MNKYCDCGKFKKEFADRLAELEKKILDSCLSKGYKLLEEQTEDDTKWYFAVMISTIHKQKELCAFFFEDGKKSTLFYTKTEDTKEMFNQAMNYFKPQVKGVKPDFVAFDEIESEISPNEVFKKVGYESEEHF